GLRGRRLHRERDRPSRHQARNRAGRGKGMRPDPELIPGQKAKHSMPREAPPVPGTKLEDMYFELSDSWLPRSVPCKDSIIRGQRPLLECWPVRSRSAIWLLLLSYASADTIHLKNGGTIQADSVRETGERVEYDIGDNTYAIPKSSVDHIDT